MCHYSKTSAPLLSEPLHHSTKICNDHDTFTLTCLATEKNMTPLLNDNTFTEDRIKVRQTWLDYVSSGNGKLVEPEKYITVRNEK